MMNYLKCILFGLILITFGCTSGVRFYVSPYELSVEVKSKLDMGQKKEVLANQDYRVVVVEKDINGGVFPAKHYRPEHTFGNRVHPRIVTFDEPLTLTALIIIDEVNNTNGIAIRKLNDNFWRIYWLQESDISDLRKEGVVYLPPYDDLPLLEK